MSLKLDLYTRAISARKVVLTRTPGVVRRRSRIDREAGAMTEDYMRLIRTTRRRASRSGEHAAVRPDRPAR